MSIDEIPKKTLKKKQEIIAAARVVFDKYGYKKSTMVDIAKELDLNQATLYHYFQNKEELFIEKILADHAIFREKRTKVIVEESSILQKITSFFTLKIRFFIDNRIDEQIGELNRTRISENHKKALDNLSRQEQAYIKNLLESAVQSGELPSSLNSTQLTRIIFRIYQGIRFQNKFNFFVSKQEIQPDLLIKEMEQSIEYLFNNIKR
jgi:AcrR family transcriptional regulator